jgi:valyl-tRNA synthetase
VKARKNLENVQKKLSNENFVSKAPEHVIAGVRETEAKAVALVQKLEESLVAFS